MEIKFPLQIDKTGKVATTGFDQHIKEMIRQVLFTTPGERVNRPEFGCDLMSLVYEPLESDLVVTTQFMIQSSLNQWLENWINVEAVEVESDQQDMLYVRVRYKNLRTGDVVTSEFSNGAGG